jgi:hypothetical protein
MEFKGTQGKWVVKPALGIKDNGKPVFFYIEDQNQMSIAYTIQNKYNGVSEEQEIANALLISKAPEMLDMLQYLLFFDLIPEDVVDNIEQLIKEAIQI